MAPIKTYHRIPGQF